MTDHIGEAPKKVIDLDALEKLADEAGGKTFWTASKSGLPQHRNVSFFIYDGGTQLAETNGDLPHIAAFMERFSPATIKALIAEMKEARGLIAPFAYACDCYPPSAQDTYPLAPDDNNLTLGDLRLARAFLARNGKGEG